MRRALASLCAAAAAGSLAAGSSAGKVGWNEQAKDGKVPIMRFRVDSFTFGKGHWSAHVTVSNLSKVSIRVGDQFGAAIYADGKTENLDRAIGFAEALSFSPARPALLKPGASWSGTIGGDGKLRPSTAIRWARIVFGPLRGLPGQKGSVFWVTDHALALPPTAASSNPNVI